MDTFKGNEPEHDLIRKKFGTFKNAYELLNRKCYDMRNMHICHCIGKINCVELQSVHQNSTQNISSMRQNMLVS